MDEGTLRKQIIEQVQDQFDNQLREMRRDKMNLEEEMEAASQRFRSERRRLNAEIERLEEALSKNFAAPNPEELQTVVDEKLRQASADWVAERQRLQNEIGRLELAVTEALTRLSNPMRSTQQIKDQFELKLSEAETLRLRIEREFLNTRSKWEEDKKTLLTEVMKLRRMVPTGGSQIKEVMDRVYMRTETVEEARIRELEAQLAESRASVLQYHERALKTAQELTSAKKEIQELNVALTQIREEIHSGSVAQLKREHAASIEDMVQKHEQLTQELQVPRAVSGNSSEMIPTQGIPPGASPAVDGEVTRIRQSIADIEKLIEDPDTSASTIARKNIERKELEAYLRGLLFSVGC
ncbi:MAG TPA: hypothetical protein VGK48_07980 [Terriglobia bacterium]|jgi:uncharacterized coiled-coil DUF342 family protein